MKLPLHLQLELYWFNIKKNIWCRWFGKKSKKHRRCYPDVSDKGLNGEWHCGDCFSCSWFLEHLEEINKAND